ncbi:MAG: Flp pilus assembly complex ATPase component TadA [Elusimicrobia bacterium]|nr:Flp pilus assembly complex ATPase component TadA [Elusimicrobiota bacterium]
MPTLTRRGDEWLIRLLVSKGLLGRDDAEALRQSEARHASEEIIGRKLLTKEQLAQAVQDKYGIPFAEPEAGALDKLALSLVPERLCRERLILPLKLDGEAIVLLMANPIEDEVLETVMALTGRRPVPVLGLPARIEGLVATGYGADAILFDLLKKLPDEAPVEFIESGDGPRSERKDGAVGAPVIRLANLIIAQAVRMKASDIHIEHDDKMTVVRYRIDGDLRSTMKIPKHIGEGPLVTRIKIMASLDIADRRRPQDGRAKLRVGTEEIGLRVSTIPTSFGEKVVLRILDRRQAEVPLEALGFRPEILSALLRVSQSNQGLLLITGPTGSGKTTTLYSLLNRAKSDNVNITTVEDPIEYRLEGINQVQVNVKAGLDFASTLRSILRQDPDVVLVGEIRDRETADIALQAALTGHMVFSTLHTNDALSTVTRLLDMGVERFKMAPALVGVAAQKLVRRICGECRVEAAPGRFKGKGCERCAFTGLLGRIALTEFLDLGDQAARDILASPDGHLRLREEARRRGWLKTLHEDALWHVAQGNITLEEAAAYLDPQDGQKGGSPQPPAPPPASRPIRAQPRVLIVDDNADNRNVIRDTIKTDGYDAAEADGGKAAIEEIVRRKPDLVLLDLMMPEVDGFAVVKKLRGELGLSDLPIMVITAMSESDSQALALELGADDYMTKPFIPKILKARVKALFRRKDALR